MFFFHYINLRKSLTITLFLSFQAAGPPVQLEPVDLSLKTPVVLQVPRYSPAALIAAATAAAAASSARKPPPVSPTTQPTQTTTSTRTTPPAQASSPAAAQQLPSSICVSTGECEIQILMHKFIYY